MGIRRKSEFPTIFKTMDVLSVDQENQVTGQLPEKLTSVLTQAWAESGHRLTPQRQMVLKVLYSAMNQYHDCEALFRMVKAEYPRIGRVTVYRTLTLLKKANLLSVISGAVKTKRYRLRMPDEPRRQLTIVCWRCGNFRSCNDSMDQFVKVLKRKGFDLEEARFYGICPECSGELSGKG
jgi:Fe2+ or Zn2+ uptake regulation protein